VSLLTLSAEPEGSKDIQLIVYQRYEKTKPNAQQIAEEQASYLGDAEKLFDRLKPIWQLGPSSTVPVRISISSPLSTNKVTKFQAWLVSKFGKISLPFMTDVPK
jgi:hypothetical protein